MSNLTRRAILRGSTAAAVAAASLSLPAVASADPEPDAELLCLERQRAELSDEQSRVDDALGAAVSTLPEWARYTWPQHPRNNLFSVVRANDQGLVSLEAIRDFNRETEGIVEDWRDMEPGPVRQMRRAKWIERRAAGRQRVAWWREQAAAIEAEHQRVGLRGLVGRSDGLGDEMSEIEGRIRDTPAAGIVGITVKLRMARTCLSTRDQSASTRSEDLALAALADVERLVGKGGVA